MLIDSICRVDEADWVARQLGSIGWAALWAEFPLAGDFRSPYL
jgi:hypothetical protein